ncbi:MAG TPA: hypothetical protein VIL85_19725 [Thermomicrobiales bacterium]
MQQAEITPHNRTAPSAPMGLLEIVALCGGILILIQGFGLVFGRLSGTNVSLLSCLSPFFYIGAGLLAGRYATIANGVWAGIAVAAIDTVVGMVFALFSLPSGFEQMQRQLGTAAPAGLVGFIIVFVVILACLNVLIVGSLCGAIGGVIGRSGPFRPRDRDDRW